MQATTVREALRASLAGTFGTVLSVLPRIIVFAIALAIGWAISSLLARATVAALGAVRFDEMARRSGLARFIENMGVEQVPTSLVANVSKWLVRLLTLVVSLDVLGLPAGSGVLHQMLLWLPNLVVALVALVIGGLAAIALSRLVRGFAAGAGLPNPRVLAAGTSVAVWAFAIVVAVSQLGIATPVVNLALVGVIGAIALATGLAFGWAGRERAAQLLSLLDDWRAGLSSQPGPTSPSATTSGLDPSPPEITASAAASELSTSVLESSAPEFESSTPELEGSTPELEGSASRFESPTAEYESPRPEFETPRPEVESSTPEFDVSMPEFDTSVREFDASAPEFDPSASDFDASAPGFGASEPQSDHFGPELDGSAPQLDAFAPDHVASALEPEPAPADDPTFAPDRAVPFEETWVPRSGVDRRRI